MNPHSHRRSLGYFLFIGYGLAWLGWTVNALTAGSLPPGLTRALFYMGDFMAVAGFVATWVAAGAPGVRHLFRRFLPSKAPPLWVVFAVLLPLLWKVTPVVVYGVTHDGVGAVNWGGFLKYLSLPALIAFTTGPIGEEAGWRGYLLPRLLGRYSPFAGSIVLGLIWSLWHYPLYYNTVFGSLDHAVQFTLATISFSMLMTVLWAYTGGSVFWAMIFHWSVNVTEPVVSAVFPKVRPESATAGWLEAVILAAVAVAAMVMVGPDRLDRQLAEVRGSLSDEAVDGDRVAAPTN